MGSVGTRVGGGERRRRGATTVGLVDRGVDPTAAALRRRHVTAVRVDPTGRRVLEGSHDEARPWNDHHGVATASLIVGGRFGRVNLGPAPWARLLAVAALEDGEVIARVLVAIDWLLGQRIGVLCLPLGIRGRTPVFARAMAACVRHDVVTVVAAGNDGPGRVRAPADSPDVLSVGAADASGRPHAASGSWPAVDGSMLAPDVLAPGVDVVAARGAGTALVTGTSYAAARVAGVVAVCRRAHPDAAEHEVRRALVAGSRRRLLPDDHDVPAVDLASALAALGTRHSAGGCLGERPGARRSGCREGRFVDGFLVDQVAEAHDHDLLRAVVTAPDEGWRDRVDADPRGVAMDLPRVGYSIVTATRPTLAGLISDTRIDMVSSTTIDRRASLQSPTRVFARSADGGGPAGRPRSRGPRAP